jgi:hypothetical protein
MMQKESAAKVLNKLLKRYGRSSIEGLDTARNRVWKNLSETRGDADTGVSNTFVAAPVEIERKGSRLETGLPYRRLRWPALATVVAAILVAVCLPPTIVRSAPAVFEDASGSRSVGYGELVRLDEGDGL